MYKNLKRALKLEFHLCLLTERKFTNKIKVLKQLSADNCDFVCVGCFLPDVDRDAFLYIVVRFRLFFKHIFQ